MIDQSVIEEIKARNDIVDLISSYVSLKRGRAITASAAAQAGM